MQFEIAKETAERLGVTVRAVQKWAKQGRIPGAFFDRCWNIPKDFSKPLAISEYAISAMQYATGSGILHGKTESTLNPLDNATRAEIAAILHRFIEVNK